MDMAGCSRHLARTCTAWCGAIAPGSSTTGLLLNFTVLHLAAGGVGQLQLSVACRVAFTEAFPRSLPQVRNSAKTPLLTALLEGPAGTGKTALAASMGIDSDFPFVKVCMLCIVLHTCTSARLCSPFAVSGVG